MTIRRTGGDGAKVSLMIYMLLFWTSGLALLFIGLWMLLDPKRNYMLHLVDLSEDDPLLFMLCLFLLFLADVSIGTLVLVFRNKFANGQLTVYMKNLALNRYSRDAWVKPLIDTIQFYLYSPDSKFEEYLQNLIKFSYGVPMEIEESRNVTRMIDKLQFYEECCGVNSGDDYLASRWAAAVAADPIYEFEDPPLVPLSCCRQLIGSSALNPIAKSMARCQQSNTNRNWRHTTQQCCGSIGPRDYYNSFWFITNTDRGTRSFVPPSCCRQSQAGRAWSLVPIDPMCTLYYYDSQAFTSSVYNIVSYC
ncbi:unnamed protein product [Angiostrongylus costaricensis]|uniref:Tetraspanin n=1 Tax=Angiostrongylus costaricensis TaxID=334426 RepID=A0A0R3PXZ0_ANGCS|nr:unnamed protein product [Angiostrongylus costaricensis]